MIHPEQMIPLFLEACPGLQPSWSRYVVQTMNGKDHSFQPNPVLEVVFPYLLGHVRRNYFKEIPAACVVMETLLSEGDEETRILVETDILIPLQSAVALNPQSAEMVEQCLGSHAQVVWQVIEHIDDEQEQEEQHTWPTLGSSFEEARSLYAAFGLIGGGPTGLTYMGWGGEMNLLSLGILALIWIGLSIAEQFQRKQLMLNAQARESSENDLETDGTDLFMVQRMWKLLDRATWILFVLGIPIVLSIVMGHKIFLDSSLLDSLIVVVGAVAVVAILFRDRLWTRSKRQAPESVLKEGYLTDEHSNTVDVSNTRTDSGKRELPWERRAA